MGNIETRVFRNTKEDCLNAISDILEYLDNDYIGYNGLNYVTDKAQEANCKSDYEYFCKQVEDLTDFNLEDILIAFKQDFESYNSNYDCIVRFDIDLTHSSIAVFLNVR